MNLRKGIFRIFLVLSGLWFIIFALIANQPGEPVWTLIAVGVGVPAPSTCMLFIEYPFHYFGGIV